MKPALKQSNTVAEGGLSGYAPLLTAVKNRIRAAQVKATLSANAELIRLYWDIGRAIDAMQQKEGWGAGVIPRLAQDIANDLPEVRGFSERNIKLMTQFAAEYPNLFPIGQPPVAQLASASTTDSRGQPLVALLPGVEKAPQAAAQERGLEISPQPVAKMVVHDEHTILQQLVAQLPWAHNVLLIQKAKDLRTRFWHMRQTIEHGWSRNILALQIDSRAYERRGTAFHNFHATLPPPQSDLAEQVLKDPYIFDWKMNFYCNVLDVRLRHPDDKPTIGLILCQDKNRIIAEYALRGVKKAIGVSEYRLTRALPKELRSSLPTLEEMERQLTRLTAPRATGKWRKE